MHTNCILTQKHVHNAYSPNRLRVSCYSQFKCYIKSVIVFEHWLGQFDLHRESATVYSDHGLCCIADCNISAS